MRSNKTELMRKLVDRFLAWPLPKSVCADTCATDASYPHPRSGTNLLNATEAEEMLRYVLDESDIQRSTCPLNNGGTTCTCTEAER